MVRRLELEIQPQPDETTCGPTCLHAVYQYLGDAVELRSVIEETPRFAEGGTLAVWLGCHARRRGYRATIYTYNLEVFDPTWFEKLELSKDEDPPLTLAQAQNHAIIERLETQMKHKDSPRLRHASGAYIEFLRLGGKLRMHDLTPRLLRRYLRRAIPLLVGLSATYLYNCKREVSATNQPDDICGQAVGHFVVLCGYDEQRQTVQVADPYLPNPLGETHYYEVGFERLVCAILLGVLTYDANLLIIQPAKEAQC